MMKTISSLIKPLKILLLALGTSLLQACFLLDITPVDDIAITSGDVSDVENIAVEVGSIAPDFSLKDGEGVEHRLSDILKTKNALVIFYRGDWCPFCIDQLDSINAVLGDISAKGVQVIGISPDEAAAVTNTQRRFGQDFIFLSDVNSQVIQRYGIQRDEKLPHPAQFIINQKGEITWLYAGTNYRERPTGAQLVDAINQSLN